MTEFDPRTKEKTREPIVIERAVPEDAESLVRLKRDGWLAAYTSEEHGVTTEDIQKKFPEDAIPTAIENWQKGLANEKEDGERATFVARLNGKVVGFTSPHTENGQRRVGQLYVAPDEWGKGIGSQLLQKTLDWHGPEEPVYLHVLSHNENAIRLYEQFGFQKTGVEFPEEFDKAQGIKLLAEIEMVRQPKA